MKRSLLVRSVRLVMLLAAFFVSPSAAAPAPLRRPARPLTITTTSLPNATMGVPYDATISVSGGSGNYTSCNINAASISNGFKTDLRTLKITGTPKQAVRSFTIRVTVKDSAGASATRDFRIRIDAPQPPRIVLSGTSSSSPTLYVGKGYNASFTVSGMKPLSITRSGSLPPGLQYSSRATSDGAMATISGVPTKKGSWSYTLIAKNSGGTTTRTLRFLVK